MHASLIAPGAIESDIWDKTSSYKQKLKRSVDPEVSKAYEFFIKVGEKMADHMKPIPAINVARALEHSLTSDKPKLAYWIGDDAKKVRMLLKLPRRFMNWLIIKHMSQIVSRS